MAKIFTADEVAQHNKADDLWIVIDDKVYDMSTYYTQHPGGSAMLRNAGADSSRGFHSNPAHKTVHTFTKQLLEKLYVGDLK